MKTAIILSASLLLSINQAIVYVPHVKSYQEARQFCRNVYGTELATIATDDDRAEAVLDIDDSDTDIDQAWIGLYSHSDRGNWNFLNNDDCPYIESYYKCVEFWIYRRNENSRYRPRCIGPSEPGYNCAYFDSSQNGVDNNIECESNKLPFFCEGNGDSTCEIPGTVQRGYPLTDLTDNGWIKCYQNSYSDGNSLNQLQTLCPTGTDYYLFVGALENVNSQTVHVGAFGPSSVLTTRTYSQSVAVKPTELENDVNYNVYWHNSVSTWSSGNAFGFSPQPEVHLSSADVQSVNVNYRLSWHMDIGTVGGWSAGEYRGLNSNTIWQKIIYYKQCNSEETLNGDNPELDVGRQYYVVSGAQTYADAQLSCQDTYGTDLATITTQTDMDDAIYIMNYNQVTRAWIGLNDQNQEGTWKWIDGTPCTNNDGTCSDLWDFTPNNRDDIDSDTNADCGLLTSETTGSTEGNTWDGTTKLELSCDDNSAVALCNSNDNNIV
eukprot:CAMPEP_0201566810 /NCGR_PEP_ID=MMETSP0190_2-20130828/6897_1 /ASSEMBLY_ACC=CAM_ASM_000263 /TAXON_ID=37353 /ORGANISM="Rosalina sp." /LENGTH=491 /DNA_ID=CAMNT_0047986041 /DNA_START=104 /DNA_END=1579 /DNA_ORIENTATION=-